MKRTLTLFLWSLALAGSLSSCGDNVVDPKLPAGATQFTPPPAYTIWWEMTKACSGRSGSLDAVTWYEAPADFFVVDGRQVSAYWSAGSNQIVVSESVARNGQVIRHEMLHALLGTKGHSRAEFLERCGGYVACTSQCVEDAGPAPVVPPSVARVAPSAMDVTMDIAPNVIRSSVDEGHFTVTVRARNPAPNEVFVVLPGQDEGSPPISFSYHLIGPNQELFHVLALDPDVARFAAGEAKVHVFDFFVGDGAKLGYVFPGQYTMRGAFGQRAAPDEHLQVF